MAPTNISQQTTTTALPLQGELARAAPQPRPLRAGNFRGPLQWALDGPGWRLVRPALDFLLLCLAATAALGGIHRLLYPQADAAPLLAMPPLVTTGVAGLGIRKIAYRNIDDVEEVWRGSGETRLRIHTIYGTDFLFNLPTRSVPVLHERLQAAQPPE